MAKWDEFNPPLSFTEVKARYPLSFAEVAERVGVSKLTLRLYLKRIEVPHYQGQNSYLRFTREAVTMLRALRRKIGRPVTRRHVGKPTGADHGAS